MKITFPRGLLLAAFAYLGLASGMAQAASPEVAPLVQTTSSSADKQTDALPAVKQVALPNDDAKGAAFFGVEEKVPGLAFSRPDWVQLRDKGVLVKEPFLRARFERVAAKYGWDSPEMLKELDKASKEGTTITVYRFVGGEGISMAANYKGTDIAGNCFRIAGWSLAGNSSGKMLYNHFVCNENWQTILAKTATSAIGSAFAGATTAAVSNATAPTGGGDTWYIQGGKGGNASSAALNETNVQTTANTRLDATFGASPGTCSTCGSPPSGHTQNGPGN